MEATAFTDRSNRKEKACKKEESIYGAKGLRAFALFRLSVGLCDERSFRLVNPSLGFFLNFSGDLRQ